MAEMVFDDLEEKGYILSYKNKIVKLEGWYNYTEKMPSIEIPIDTFIKYFSIPMSDIRHCYSAGSFIWSKNIKAKITPKKTMKDFLKKYNLKLKAREGKLFLHRPVGILHKVCLLEECSKPFTCSGPTKNKKYCSIECYQKAAAAKRNDLEWSKQMAEARVAKKELNELKKKIRDERLKGNIISRRSGRILICSNPACGKEFTSPQVHAKYCCRDCSQEAQRTGVWVEVLCLNCNKTIRTKQNAREKKFCNAECHHEFNRKEWEKKNGPKRKYIPKGV